MLNTFEPCGTAEENSFGPVVSGQCLMGFDFTLLFEETILTLGPLCTFLLLAPYRIYVLSTRPKVAKRSWLFYFKILVFALYLIFQLSLLATWATKDLVKTKATVATTAVVVGGFVLLMVLSIMEHERSVRPSTYLNLFLGLSILLDVARVRTLFAIPSNQTIAVVYYTSFCVKLLLLALEIVEKRTLLKQQWKDRAPEELSGIYNRGLFLWMNTLICRGYRKILTMDILLPIDEELLNSSEPTLLKQKWTKAKKKSRHSLLFVLCRHYKNLLMSGIPPRLGYIGFEFVQPFLVQSVLDFVQQPVDRNTTKVAGGLTASYALAYIGIAVCFSWYEHQTYRLVTAFRGSLVSMIFDKTLRISSSAVDEAEAVTHMSADIERIGLGIGQIHKIYGSVIELGIAIWLLARLLGVATAAAAAFVMLCVLLGMLVASMAGRAQGPWLEAISKRLAVTSSYVTSLKGIRLTGLVEKARSDLSELREVEIKASLVHRLYSIFVLTISFASTACAPPIGFAVFAILAKARGTTPLGSGVAYAALTLFLLLEAPLIVLIEGFEQFQTALVALTRIQEYLESPERQDYRVLLGTERTSSSATNSTTSFEKVKHESQQVSEKHSALNGIAIDVQDFSASYSDDKPPVVRNMNLRATNGQVTMIMGPVGCGKSTFLKGVLGEMPNVSGTIAIASLRAAYCSQSPWLPSGTIRQIILGQREYHSSWYEQVVHACNLETDFSQLPSQDLTKTGSGGTRLSGGQRGRVALARALYSRESIMLLDDCLNGLDKTTEKHVLEAVFGSSGLLRGLGTTVLMTISIASHAAYADHILSLDERGQVVHQGDYKAMAQSGHLIAQSDDNTAAGQRSQVDVDVLAQVREKLGSEAQLPIAEDEDQDAARAAGDTSVYIYYFSTAGWTEITIWLALLFFFVFTQIFPSYWLIIWTDHNEQHPNQHLGFYLGIYGMLAGLQVVFMFASEWIYLLRIVPTTARRFHDYLLTSVLGTNTAFLTTTEVGSIINRFGQDLQLIDNDLQVAFLYFVFHVIATFGQMISIFVGSGYFAAVIPLALAVLYLIQHVYLKTSRQVRLLDIEAKAPLFSGFLETLGGLSSIRAYGWSDAYGDSNRRALDRSQKPYYLLWTCQRWLTLVLGLVTAGLAIVLVALVAFKRGSSSNYLATALFNVVGFGVTIEDLIQAWTQLEMALGAVARIKKFAKETPIEDDVTNEAAIPDDWPRNGDILFNEVSASYDKTSGPVLKCLTLRIRDGERIALCGRTGSGKSSLVATLLRTLELDAGSVFVDGVDVSSIRRQRVRERYNTITQDAFLLKGSIRTNLDPHGDFAQDEHVLIDALKQVHLDEVLLAGSDVSLDVELEDTQLSHGQKQLFCLARAVVAAPCTPIVIIDEATSGVDGATERLMTDIIEASFRGKTVIMIAHHLESVLNFDRVAILEHGKLVEFDSPKKLLGEEKSAFRALWEAQGL